MPLIDFNTLARVREPEIYDHVIVGAGAAGILLGIHLSRRGQRVLILESGHLEHDDERQALNRIEQSAKRLGDPLWSRKRAVGGTTIAWGGQSLPFSPIDFSPRQWVEHSNWPISWQNIAPYYSAANRFMGIDELDYDAAALRRVGLKNPGFDEQVYRYHVSKWARQPNFFKLHGRELENSTTVLYNAHVLRIHLREGGAVGAVEISNFAGTVVRIPVRSLVLACGSIETNRLLLLSNHQRSGGLGNHSGWLGRGYMDHPCVEVGRVTASDVPALQWQFGTHLYRARKYSTRLSAASHWMKQNRLLNVSASILWSYPDPRDNPVACLKQFLARPKVSSLLQAGSGSAKLMRMAYDVAVRGFIPKPGATARLMFMSEQEPRRDSYIALGQATDRFGCRVARLNWRISPLTWTTIVAYARAIEKDFERLRLGRVDLSTAIRHDYADWESLLSDVNHHMGGTRMSATPEEGVVDANLQVWGIPNLHICSASAFPTGSHSNPTLTLLALAVRLSEHLARTGAKGAQCDSDQSLGAARAFKTLKD